MLRKAQAASRKESPKAAATRPKKKPPRASESRRYRAKRALGSTRLLSQSSLRVVES